jgi:hypothetical protein
LCKDSPRAAVAFINNRVFRADTLFIRAENAVGARSAQWLMSDNAYFLSFDAKASASLTRTAAVRAENAVGARSAQWPMSDNA